MRVCDAFVGVKLPQALKLELQTMAQGERQSLGEWIRAKIREEAERRVQTGTTEGD